MPTARKYQISLSDTPYYHCISRCVRRAFLCGEDKLTGKSYEHRKQWVVDKLAQLAQVFAIDVCAYAIMSNHTHTVLKVNIDKAKHWSNDEVIKQWTNLFSAGTLVQRYLDGDCNTQAEINKITEQVEIWRERLSSISWFMRCLNESIARQANAEDKCSGRFWQGRFKSQALLNEQAVLACMVYVDLNPIRAGLSNNLESSEFTAIAQRIREISMPCTDKSITVNKSMLSDNKKESPSITLAPFIGASQSAQGIAYQLADYLELADWTGRLQREDKKGTIPDYEPKILHKLGISSAIWLETIDGFNANFYTFIGSTEQLQAICQKQQKKWLMGMGICHQLFNSTPSCELS